jgi:hypothetical protein
LAPNTAVAGDFSLYLIVQGSNLYSVKINWNGSPLDTFPVSNTLADASVPSGLLATPGTVLVTAVPTFGSTGPSALAKILELTDRAASGLLALISLPAGPPPSIPATGLDLTAAYSVYVHSAEVRIQ